MYELDKWSRDINDKFNLKDCLFGAVKLTKDANLNKYSYSGYWIEFDSRSLFSFPNLIGVKISLFLELIWAHLCMLMIKIKNILILGKGETIGLDNTSLTAEVEYSINFS